MNNLEYQNFRYYLKGWSVTAETKTTTPKNLENEIEEMSQTEQKCK